MEYEAIPSEYDDENTFHISSSQADKLKVHKKGCKRKWRYNYIDRLRGAELHFYPFEYGNYAHDIVERTVPLRRKDREAKFFSILQNDPIIVPKRFTTRIFKAAPYITKTLMQKYDNFMMKPAEIPIAIKAPMNWFPDGLEGRLANMKLTTGEYLSFSGFGFRGLIDYAGEDVNTGQKAMIDWKAGKFKEEYEEQYHDQLCKYYYSSVILGMEYDVLRIEFFEGHSKKSYADRTYEIEPDFDLGKRLVKADMQLIADAMMLEPNDKNFPKNISDDCVSCQYAATCLMQRSTSVAGMYYKVLI